MQTAKKLWQDILNGKSVKWKESSSYHFGVISESISDYEFEIVLFTFEHSEKSIFEVKAYDISSEKSIFEVKAYDISDVYTPNNRKLVFFEEYNKPKKKLCDFLFSQKNIFQALTSPYKAIRSITKWYIEQLGERL